MIDPIDFLVGLKYIRKDYAMWQEAAGMIVQMVGSWPEFIEPPGPKIQAFTEKDFGWRQFLPRWLRDKALDDIERWLGITVGLGTVMETRTIIELTTTMMTSRE